MWFHIFFSLIISVFTLNQAFAGPDSAAIKVPLAEQALITATVSQDQHLFAVGTLGHILKRHKSEPSWQQAALSKSPLLTAIAADKSTLIAVGHDSSIFTSYDAGESWDISQFLPETDLPLLAVMPLADNHWIALGAYGAFYRSQDNGKSWQFEFHQELLFAEDAAFLDELKQQSYDDYLYERAAMLPHFNGIERLQDGRLVITGEMGFIAVGDPMAKAFKRIESPYEGSFFSVKRLADGQILFGGLQGNLFVANHDLSEFTQVSFKVKANINHIDIGPDHGIYLATNGGRIFRADPSLDFTLIYRSKGQDFTSLEFVDEQLLAFGSKGVETVPLASQGGNKDAQ
ncbi:YCF48-related protein [Paraferrimonas sp. SM1919]|uniref:WD40/YVTN/BNR-like repeat-containing protein n=1 Tax=Paraferrimonas sp. SM1919 TaxID=2662263 RepID=UPI0013D8B785|nr:YCF48-related protein [Paraferrimonas sp. SM1919]